MDVALCPILSDRLQISMPATEQATSNVRTKGPFASPKKEVDLLRGREGCVPGQDPIEQREVPGGVIRLQIPLIPPAYLPMDPGGIGEAVLGEYAYSGLDDCERASSSP